jgi:methionine biosynthesis protein MetW
MNPSKNKRQVDFHAIAQWVGKGERVLDLGCGRGVLLEYLKQKNQVYGIGVDIDFQKILSCIKRGVSAYQGDIKSFLNQFDDNSFDHVILSRTIDQLEEPDLIISKSL